MLHRRCAAVAAAVSLLAAPAGALGYRILSGGDRPSPAAAPVTERAASITAAGSSGAEPASTRPRTAAKPTRKKPLRRRVAKPAAPQPKAKPRSRVKAGSDRARTHGAPRRRRARRQPQPHRATPSYYIQTLSGRQMAARGCRTARRRASGIVILAFGRMYTRRGVYGTQTFSGAFASNRSITTSMRTFARAYVRCLPRGSRARIVLGRGTSNYSPAVPNAYRAGWRWARETVFFDRFLRRSGLGRHVQAAAAIDAEPAWNPGFRRTRELFRGYAARRPGIVLYNFGSLDGGVGSIWNARQVWYVSSGMRYVRMIPEIYYPGMAEQWAAMSRLAVRRFGRPVRFAGVMTQRHAVPGCGCGYWPHEAHRKLVRALGEHPETRVEERLPLTNISWE